ncbi:hypothetical protein B0H13DRAFT_2663995 [Mycena leptocephala]|nr:hypothetical protein B0H13DRAFT_2663995 [Mycena leptocephala]
MKVGEERSFVGKLAGNHLDKFLPLPAISPRASIFQRHSQVLFLYSQGTRLASALYRSWAQTLPSSGFGSISQRELSLQVSSVSSEKTHHDPHAVVPHPLALCRRPYATPPLRHAAAAPTDAAAPIPHCPSMLTLALADSLPSSPHSRISTIALTDGVLDAARRGRNDPLGAVPSTRFPRAACAPSASADDETVATMLIAARRPATQLRRRLSRRTHLLQHSPPGTTPTYSVDRVCSVNTTVSRRSRRLLHLAHLDRLYSTAIHAPPTAPVHTTSRMRSTRCGRSILRLLPPHEGLPRNTPAARSLRLPRTTNPTRAPSYLHHGGGRDFPCPNFTRLPPACPVPAQPFTLAHAAFLPSSTPSPSSPQRGPKDAGEGRSASPLRSRHMPPVAHRSPTDSTNGLSATSCLVPSNHVLPFGNFDAFPHLFRVLMFFRILLSCSRWYKTQTI